MRFFITSSVFIVLLCTVCFTSANSRDNITVSNLSVSVVEEKIQVDCEVSYGVHSQVKEALSNGIEMTFALEIELRQQNLAWLDPRIGVIQREFKIKYHALSKQYVMREEGSHMERSFPDLYSAFYYQRQLHNAELASASVLNEQQIFYLRARARLVSEKLPLPLRIKSYLSANWRPSSGWTIWPV